MALLRILLVSATLWWVLSISQVVPCFSVFPVNFGYLTLGGVAGKFDAKNVPSLAVLSDAIGILHNNGTGGFSYASADVFFTAGGFNPNGVDVADFNLDGNLDIAFSLSGVNVMMGYGNGSFAAPVNIPASPKTSAWSNALTARDLNGDSKPDIAVVTFSNANYSGDGTLSILLNTASSGIASFTTERIYDLGSTYAASLGVADFNNDGHPDLVVTTYTASFLIFVNLGNGTFQDPVVLSWVEQPYWVVTGDFNKDSRPDIAFGSGSSSGLVGVFLNNGTGMSVSFSDPGVCSMGFAVKGLATADMNGDGNLDLVATGGSNSTFSVFLNLGSGTFSAEYSFNFSSGLTYPNQVITADFNGDGRADVFIGTGTSPYIGFNGCGSALPAAAVTAGTTGIAKIHFSENAFLGSGSPVTSAGGPTVGPAAGARLQTSTGSPASGTTSSAGGTLIGFALPNLLLGLYFLF